MPFKFHRIPVGICNSFLLRGDRTILIDGGAMGGFPAFQRQLKVLNVDPHEIELILLTHGHWDHITCLADIQKLTGAKIAIHGRDQFMVETGEPPFPDRFEYLMLNFNDRVTTDLHEPAQALANYFNRDGKQSQEGESRLMIYCGAGMSRSPALAISWLIKVKKMSFEDAYKLVRIGRGPKFVRMNDGFMRQLREM